MTQEPHGSYQEAVDRLGLGLLVRLTGPECVPAPALDALRKCAYAQSRSNDPSTRNAACLIYPHDTGLHEPRVNTVYGYAEGMPREEKMRRALHAEVAAVVGQRYDFSWQPKHLAVLWYACEACAVAMIGAGVTRVYGHAAMLAATPPRWAESVRRGLTLMNEAGVECVYVDQKHFGALGMVDGRPVAL